MGRSKKAAAHGHNSGEPLTEDEIAALEAYYSQKIRAQQRKAAETKAAFEIEREEVNSLFALVKGELKTSRLDFQDLLNKQNMTPTEFANWWKKTGARYARNGLPVDTQQELPLGDTADDKALAHAMGFLAGQRGDDPDKVPESVSPILHADFLAGWSDGQADLFAKMAKADGILSARKAAAQAAKPELTADDEADEEEDDGDPEVIRRKAKALKDSGWTEPTTDETQFGAAA